MKFPLCICLLLFVTTINHNQENPYRSMQLTPARDDQPLFVGEYVIPNQTMWSPDSKTLYFTGVDVSKRYYRYTVESRQLTQLDVPPFTKTLTTAEQAKFDAANAVAYPSPDGKYIVYVSSVQGCRGNSTCYSKLAVGDMDSGKYVLINGYPGRLEAVYWSTNSRAFVILSVQLTGGLGGVEYVSVPSTFKDAIDPILLMNYMAGDEGFVDISPDGRRVLLREQWDGRYTGLYVWDVAVANTRQQFSAVGSPLILKDTPIAGAAFLRNKNGLLIVTDTGIVQYDLDTHTTTLVQSGIDATWADWALFSPDAKHVAVLAHSALSTYRSRSCFVYIFALNGQFTMPPRRNQHCRSYG